MSFREFIKKLDEEDLLVKVSDAVDPYLEVAKILFGNDGKTVLFENVKGSEYKIAAGVCSSRDLIARAMGIEKDALIHRIAEVIDNPSEPKVVDSGVCQEVVEKDVDLSSIPIPTYTSKDLGPYITAGVYVTKDESGRLNAAIHRTSPIGKDKMVARICHRDTWKFMEEAGGELDISIALGLHPTVSLAASISAGDTPELSIANTMHPLNLVKCKTNDLLVPADAELVLEGVLSTKERATEGPFADISGTLDKVREEPTLKVNCVTHRKDPIYQALLPAAGEHRLLMGMPKEPTIYRKVSEVVKCKNVLITEGGCCWLHAIVQIKKEKSDDGMKAGEAAHQGHKSLKHCIVVDEDININDPKDVEWAIATRFQADKNAKIWRGPGSSLDCTACTIAGSDRLMTSKVVIDATIPSDKDKEAFLKAKLGE